MSSDVCVRLVAIIFVTPIIVVNPDVTTRQQQGSTQLSMPRSAEGLRKWVSVGAFCLASSCESKVQNVAHDRASELSAKVQSATPLIRSWSRNRCRHCRRLLRLSHQHRQLPDRQRRTRGELAAVRGTCGTSGILCSARGDK
jgi:hypothetical protein